MRAALTIARVSLGQLLLARRSWALLALALLPTLIFGIGQSNMGELAAYDFFHEAPLALLFAIVTPVVTLIGAAAALGDERTQHTLSFLTLRPLPRWQIAAAKAAAAWAAAYAVLAVAGLALAGTLLVTQGDGSAVAPLLLGLALNVAGYVAVFVPLGLVMRRAVLAGLGFVFVWEAGLSLAISALATFSVTRIGLSAYAGLVEESFDSLREPLGAVVPGVGGAVAKAAVLLALGVLLTTELLRRRDLA